MTEVDQIRVVMQSKPLYALSIGRVPVDMAYRVRAVLGLTQNHVENSYSMVTKVPEVVMREIIAQNFIPVYAQVRWYGGNA